MTNASPPSAARFKLPPLGGLSFHGLASGPAALPQHPPSLANPAGLPLDRLPGPSATKDRRPPKLSAIERGERIARRVTRRVEQLGRTIDTWLSGPDNSASLDIWTACGVDAADAIEHLAERHGPFDLTMATFAVGEASLRRLRKLKEAGRLTSIAAIVDGLMLNSNKSAARAALEQTADRFRTTACHAKAYILTPAKSAAPSTFTITGSANLTHNPRLEILQLSRDPALARFYREQIAGILNSEVKRRCPRKNAPSEPNPSDR